jgi:hypothetical protein
LSLSGSPRSNSIWSRSPDISAGSSGTSGVQLRAESGSVVWLPPGANRFCSREAWGKQVAYFTQFEAPFDRAISAREKVKSRLIGNLDPRDWELPPKPKWMRWRTYECLADKHQFHRVKIDQIIADYVG